MDKPVFERHISQYPSSYSLCAGCTSCEIVCSLTHDKVVGPQYNRIFLHRSDADMLHTILFCYHCSDHPCYESCPSKDKAMRLNENNIAWIDEEYCIGCGKCMRSCRFSPSRINLVRDRDKGKRKAKKCDLCRTRPEGPACVQYCPVRCIGMSDEPRPTFEPLPVLGPPPSAT
jgi:Fe-S-cluster-containing hydrogenase component 2